MNDTSSKLRVAVLFGGRSAEHDVSIMSATNVMRALDPAKYDAVPVFVTRDGRWLLTGFAEGKLATPDSGPELCLIPGGHGRCLLVGDGGEASEAPKLDILFPVLHGLHGEDGAAQGLAAVARLPLAGCGILGSAAALDKDAAKRLMKAAGLPVARSLTVVENDEASFAVFERELGLPLFVKPARQGSSVGVTKVTTAAAFDAALIEGFRHDRKLLVEEFIRGREIEFAVLETPKGELLVSRPGEIVPAEHHGFYSYDAKYIDADGAALRVPADLPAELEASMRELAARAFEALGCDGMARVDFFLQEDGRCVINELNTIPGFTNISMYPKAMAASGVEYPELIDRLIAHGLARAGRDR